MPTLYTHYEFGKSILNKLNKDLKKSINSNIKYYNIFNQGFDNLYYYPFDWKYYRKFGIKAHKTKIDLFFKNMISYIKANKLETDSSLTNMIYGFINHYILDTLIHPFINYQADNLNIPHTKIEYTIDNYLYLLKTNSSWNGKIYKELIPKVKFNNNLIGLINYTFMETYNKKNIGNVFKISHNISYYLHRYFIYDRLGIKSKLYKIVDLFTSKKALKFSENTFYIKNNDKDILNLKKLNWTNPENKKEIYNFSFEELYNISLKVCTKINNIVYKVLQGEEDINNLLKLINHISLKNIPELLEQ